MTHSGYYARQSHSHATFDKSMSSTAGDFRELTPIVMARALRAAGTTVHEPVHRFRLEAPADALGPLLPLVGRLGGVPEPPVLAGAACVVEGEIPAAQVHELRRQLPGADARGGGARKRVQPLPRVVEDDPERGALPAVIVLTPWRMPTRW